MRRTGTVAITLLLCAIALVSVPAAFAQTTPAAPAPAAAAAPAPAPAKIDSGDTAWVLMSTALVLLMTAPASPCSTAGWSGRRTRWAP